VPSRRLEIRAMKKIKGSATMLLKTAVNARACTGLRPMKLNISPAMVPRMTTR
jgi:hypothetical protein